MPSENTVKLFVYSLLQLKQEQFLLTLNFTCTFKKKKSSLPHLSDFLKTTKRLEHLAFYSSVFSLKPCCLSSLSITQPHPSHTMESPGCKNFGTGCGDLQTSYLHYFEANPQISFIILQYVSPKKLLININYLLLDYSKEQK